MCGYRVATVWLPLRLRSIPCTEGRRAARERKHCMSSQRNVTHHTSGAFVCVCVYVNGRRGSRLTVPFFAWRVQAPTNSSLQWHGASLWGWPSLCPKPKRRGVCAARRRPRGQRRKQNCRTTRRSADGRKSVYLVTFPHPKATHTSDGCPLLAPELGASCRGLGNHHHDHQLISEGSTCERPRHGRGVGP